MDLHIRTTSRLLVHGQQINRLDASSHYFFAVRPVLCFTELAFNFATLSIALTLFFDVFNPQPHVT